MAAKKVHVEILPSAARTATNTSPSFSAASYTATTFIIEVTALALTPSITITVEGLDPVSGAFYPILVSAAITTVSTNTIRVGKDFAAVTNVAANEHLPATYRLVITHGDTDSITYSIGANHVG